MQFVFLYSGGHTTTYGSVRAAIDASNGEHDIIQIGGKAINVMRPYPQVVCPHCGDILVVQYAVGMGKICAMCENEIEFLGDSSGVQMTGQGEIYNWHTP